MPTGGQGLLKERVVQPSSRRQTTSVFGNLDWFTVLLYFVLVALGWMNIYAVVYSPDNVVNIFSFDINSGRQLTFIATGVILMIVLLVVDYKVYEHLAFPIYGGIILLLLFTLAVANPVAGSRSWLDLGGGFRLQPAELAKFATALAISKYLSQVSLRQQKMKDQMILAAITFLPAVIIILQNETGSALVFGAFILAFFREGMSPLILIIGGSAAAIFILTLLVPKLYLLIGIAALMGLAMFLDYRLMRRFKTMIALFVLVIGMVFSVDYFVNDVLQPHQQNRIKALINPEADPLGYGWNVTQSKIAIGSGGFWGKGFLEGTQTKFDFVPEQSTDFIFCTIGEEHGWVGSTILIALFLLLMMRIVYIAERQKSVFGRTYGYCVVSVIFFHFVINVGMTIGLAPVVGIPLPFFSYGGSSLWSFTILLFILLAIDANRNRELVR
ncbi:MULTISPECIES: rod shape-determining protein RodA [Pontibacter]|uniref:Cell wall polymerase n=1 Tax=Pontibacter lucknowensis TaxID=1077936 RepID=A0A1N6U3Q0_9BACT|nr:MULTISPECIES: rod shape-determining protein RodA [Pontibacter]EJF11757.1 rod shape-determining protein roda [Pontibacter sp. BAB1700]SIQ60278.1 rod shape determining protein RodA [Pontibacter lucknowensis]